MFISEEIGIDLGTTTVLVFVKGKGIVLREPSVVAVDKRTNEIIAYGNRANNMIGRTPDTIETIKPLKDGVISNFTIATKMLKHYIKKVNTSSFSSPKVIICIPAKITEVEKQAVIDSLTQIGVKNAILIEEPIAAAIGVGIDINRPTGNLIVDIGGGTTDISIISLGSSVVSSSLKIAGNKYNDLIKKYIKKKYNLLIGDKTAEYIKIEIGSTFPREKDITASISGRNLNNGLPTEITIKSSEILKLILPETLKISEEIKSVIQKAPPELVEDIYEHGIYLTGGGSLLTGIHELIEKDIEIKVNKTEDAISSVINGIGKLIENKELIEFKSRMEKREWILILRYQN